MNLVIIKNSNYEKIIRQIFHRFSWFSFSILFFDYNFFRILKKLKMTQDSLRSLRIVLFDLKSGNQKRN